VPENADRSAAVGNRQLAAGNGETLEGAAAKVAEGEGDGRGEEAVGGTAAGLNRDNWRRMLVWHGL